MTSPQHPAKSRHRYTVTPRVLIFARFQDQVLLLKGAPTKPLWPDTYNGVGGHVERGETIKQAAIREFEEETGLYVTDMMLCGMVNINLADSSGDIALFIFSCVTDKNTTRPSVEGTLEWFPWNNIPTNQIMPDLPALLPRVRTATTTGQPFYALYTYNQDGSFQITFAD